MKKKITSLFLAFILIMPFALSFNVSAASDSPAEQTASYYLGNNFYSFLNPDDELEFLNTKINLKIDDSINPTTVYPKKLTDTDTQVSYLFVIDASTSMPAFAERVRDVADGLLKAEKQKFSVSVATMGENFEVLEADISSKEQALELIDGIQYVQEASEICDGILDAVSYLKSKTPQPGELMNIVVITDGDVYLSDTGRSPDAIARVAEATKTTIEDISEIAIHTVCFGQWSPTTYDTVSVGRGIDMTAYNSAAATEAGAEIAGFIDGLCRVEIQYNKNNFLTRFDAQLVTTPPDTYYTGSVELHNVRNMNLNDSYLIPLFDDEGNLIPRDPSDNPGVGEEETTAPTDKATDKPTDKATDKATEKITEKTTDATQKTQSATAVGETNDKNVFIGFPLIIIISAAIILIAVLLVFILVKRSKSKGDGHTIIKSGPSIIIKAEVINGTLKSGNTELKLYDELFIGSGDECDLVFAEVNMSAKNTRVFLKDGIIFIEDLNESSNTYLGGMKIYSSNRLRSGDEISIGNTSFILRF